LHNEEIHYLSPSSDIIAVVISRRMRWEGHVACIEEIKNSYKTLVGELLG
jgi:hypothetical protein